jgi:hypothetical protein
MTAGRSSAFGRRTFAASAAVIAVCLFAVQCGQGPTGPTPAPVPTPTVPDPNTGPIIPLPSGPVLFSGAGDIAECTDARSNPTGTAHLLESLGGRFFTTGDNAYTAGTADQFQNCYGPSWGRSIIKDRTYPVPGNHDYGDDTRPEANAYFSYFGSNAGPFGLGYYSFDYGDWHIIALNSNFAMGRNGASTGGPAGGVGPGSPQVAWLQSDLQANHAKCTLAYWHHPLFSSGGNGPSGAMRTIFRILYEANADVVLNGHDHFYERFSPQNADGVRDDARGIRQFIVGTGGHPSLTAIRNREPSSEKIIPNQHGILKLTLNTDSFAWEFVTTNSGVQDIGTATCH